MPQHKLPAMIAALAMLIAAPAALAEDQHPGDPPRNISGLVEKIQRSVVGIDAFQTVPKGLWVRTRDFLNPFPLRSFIGDTVSFAYYLPRTVVYPFSAHREASGFIIDTDGYIITSAHLVKDYNRFFVRFFDGSSRPASIVGIDDFADIALLRADLSKFGDVIQPATLGDSDTVRPGHWVMAIGHPLGLDYTVTTGIVSGLARQIGVTPLDDLIQIDAAIDAGNSGGPILNSAGEVIGIAEASFILAQNKNFAVPINMAKAVIADLKAKGYPERGEIGVIVENITYGYAASVGLAAPGGALVVGLESGSPGKAAGLRPGDIILTYSGDHVASAFDLVRRVRNSKPGDTREMEILRPAPGTRELGVRKALQIRPNLIKKRFKVL